MKDQEERKKRTVASAAPSSSAPTPESEREPATKIISGEVTTRKPAWWRRLGRSIFAEDVSSIGSYLYDDLFIPTIRNALREFGVGAIDRAIYGAKMGPRRMGAPGIMGLSGQVSNISTRYDRMTEGQRVVSREARERHDFSEIVFPDREEAMIVLEGLVARIERFRVATVRDLYNLCGVSNADFAAGGYGWTDLNTAAIRQRYGGWLLDLPEPEPIRN